MSSPLPLTNPFRTGAGHSPPFLAGCNTENDEFRKLQSQSVIRLARYAFAVPLLSSFIRRQTDE